MVKQFCLTQIGFATLGQSELVSNVKEYPAFLKAPGLKPHPRSLVSYSGSYPSAEMQSAYSRAPADRKRGISLPIPYKSDLLRYTYILAYLCQNTSQ